MGAGGIELIGVPRGQFANGRMLIGVQTALCQCGMKPPLFAVQRTGLDAKLFVQQMKQHFLHARQMMIGSDAQPDTRFFIDAGGQFYTAVSDYGRRGQTAECIKKPGQRLNIPVVGKGLFQGDVGRETAGVQPDIELPVQFQRNGPADVVNG